MPGDNKKSRARNRHSFKVWVEVEELDASGEHYGDVIVPLIGGTFASAEAAKNYAHVLHSIAAHPDLVHALAALLKTGEEV
jgi:hypothetical protein